MSPRLLPFVTALSVLHVACTQSSDPPPPRQPATAPPAPAPAPRTGDTGPAASAPGTDVATGRQGAVTGPEAHATAVGIAILKRGGNAVDAAIAVGFAAAATHPAAGNVGGGGFMVIRLPDGTATTIDYREVAPGKATRDMYLDRKGNPTKDSLRGPRAAGVPGTVAGLALAHARYGSLPWKELVMPAVELARGHELDEVHAEDLVWAVERIDTYAAELAAEPRASKALLAALRETRALYRKPDGSALAAGDTWAQPALAVTLEAIAADPQSFYRGKLAATLAAETKKLGGLWTRADLAGYQAIERAPVVFDYRGHTVITMPPPSAGGITLGQILLASEILGLHEMPWESPERIHLYVEALRRIYADRNELVADPAFVKVPTETLLDRAYLKNRMADIDRARATPSSKVKPGVELEEKTDTTHYSVVDGKGMAVANTYTLNGSFGAKLALPGTGVLLNNEMDDFTVKPGVPNLFGLVQGRQNAIAPGKRMVSSMTPTIITAGGKLRALCGSPGGPTISTTVAQVLLQLIDHGRRLDVATAATRIHHQWLPDEIRHERTLPPETARALAARGHALAERDAMGHANCIEVDPGTGEMRAVADTGRGGGDADAF